MDKACISKSLKVSPANIFQGPALGQSATKRGNLAHPPGLGAFPSSTVPWDSFPHCLVLYSGQYGKLISLPHPRVGAPLNKGESLESALEVPGTVH